MCSNRHSTHCNSHNACVCAGRPRSPLLQHQAGLSILCTRETSNECGVCRESEHGALMCVRKECGLLLAFLLSSSSTHPRTTTRNTHARHTNTHTHSSWTPLLVMLRGWVATHTTGKGSPSRGTSSRLTRRRLARTRCVYFVYCVLYVCAQESHGSRAMVALMHYLPFHAHL